MHYAIRIISPDHEDLVSITQMLVQGENETRHGHYVCPGERGPGISCRVRVFPIIPEEEKEGRKFAPAPHFRVYRPNRHISGCSRDREIQVDEDKTATGKGRTVRTTSDAVLSGYPVRFGERTSSADAAGGEGGAEGGIITDVQGGRSTGEGSGGRQHTSERTTRHVRELVHAYEAAPPAERFQMRLKISDLGCPARNYARAFRSVRRAVDRQGRPGPPYIYYGGYGSHRISHSGGISIFFAEQAVDGKPFSVWVKAALGLASVRQDLLASLWQAQAGAAAVIYVLGEFHLHEGYKYSVEIPRLNYVYVSIQGNQHP